jgi:hypothetical protein
MYHVYGRKLLESMLRAGNLLPTDEAHAVFLNGILSPAIKDLTSHAVLEVRFVLLAPDERDSSCLLRCSAMLCRL